MQVAFQLSGSRAASQCQGQCSGMDGWEWPATPPLWGQILWAQGHAELCPSNSGHHQRADSTLASFRHKQGHLHQIWAKPKPALKSLENMAESFSWMHLHLAWCYHIWQAEHCSAHFFPLINKISEVSLLTHILITSLSTCPLPCHLQVRGASRLTGGPL